MHIDHKSPLVKTAEVLFIIFLFSIPVSMAGMELGAWGSFLFIMLSLGFKKIQLTSEQKQILKKGMLIVLPYFLAVSVSAIVNDQWSLKERIDIAAEPRWIVFLFTFPILFKVAQAKILKCLPYFAAFVGIIAAYSIVQAFTGVDIARSEPYLANSVAGFWRAKGLFRGTMTYSYVFSGLFILLLSWILFTYKKGELKKPLILVALVLFGSLLLTFTRGMWIAVFASTCLLLFLNYRKMVIPVISVLVVSFALAGAFSDTVRNRVSSITNYKTNYSNVGRIYLWKAYSHIISENPVFGVGMRKGSSYLEPVFEQMDAKVRVVSHAHNNWLSVFVGAGILGFVTYMFFIIRYLFEAYKMLRREENSLARSSLLAGVLAAMVCFHIGGGTESNFLDSEVLYLFVSLLSLILFLKLEKVSVNTDGSSAA